MNSLLLDCAALFLAASVHEDVAILMAGFFVVQHDLPIGYALGAVYIGAVTNNCLVYGLGVMARRIPGMQRWLISDKVEHMRQRLQQHLVSTVVLCLLIPGSLSAAILGCGWLGIPFARFALTTVVSAALYIALISALVFTLGETALQKLGGTAWLIAFVLIAFTLLYLNCRSRNR